MTPGSRRQLARDAPHELQPVAWRLLLSLALANLALHMLAAGPPACGYMTDELNFLDSVDRLDWGSSMRDLLADEALSLSDGSCGRRAPAAAELPNAGPAAAKMEDSRARRRRRAPRREGIGTTMPRAANEVVRQRIASLGPAANLGHRGAGITSPNRMHPENSIASFLAAMSQGADGIELDAELTADGQLVIMHDDRLDRTTTCSGCVSAYTLEQAQSCRLLDGNREPTEQHPPSLEEVYRAVPRDALVNVELKVYSECLTPTTGARALAHAAVNQIRRLGVAKQTILSSFSDEALAAVKEADRSLYVGFLVDIYADELLERALQLRLEAIHPNHATVSTEQVRRARAKGLQVNVWTVDSRAHMDRAIDMGAATIITNEPGLLKRVLDARRGLPG